MHGCYFCEPRSSCLIGAKEPRPCTPGSIAPVARYLEVLARTLPASELSTCDLCQPGKFQEVEGQVECKPCTPGGYCGPKPGAAAATPCPAGYFNEDEGTANVSDCKKCSPGHSCPPGTDVPVKCAPGSRTDESKPTLAERRVCLKCKKGKFQDQPEATYCKGCESGGYCVEGAATVSPCPGGSYNERVNQSSGSHGGCTKSDRGFYAVPASTEQTPCAAGSVAPEERMARCDPCAAGTHQDEPGLLVCKVCTPGHYCEEGAPVPTACAAGSYSNASDLKSQAECTVTAAGNYSRQGSTEQTVCSRGTSAPDPGMGVCAKCFGGKYQPNRGATQCEACLLGHYCKEGASRPVPCPERTYAATTDREAIYSNTTDPWSLKMCTPTEPGHYATAGSEDQSQCSPGTFQVYGFSSSCPSCLAGTYQDELGQTECKPCKQGYYCLAGASAALPCDPATYSEATNLTNKTQCKPADPGFFATTGSAAQTPCSPGTIAPNASMSKCIKCAAGKYRGGTTNATACVACVKGYYCPPGTGAPLPCLEGTHSDRTDLVNSSQCTPTSPGYYAPVGSTKKRKCRPGSFDANGGQDRCALCPAGKYTGLTNQIECTICTESNWCAIGSPAPTPCPSGTLGGRAGLAKKDECEPCYLGSWCSAGIAIACPGDTYNDERGQTNQGACQPCPEYSVSKEGSPSRGSCACRKGYYNTNSSEHPRCAPCPAGTDCTSSGTTTASLQAVMMPGFYRYSSRSAEIRRCPDYRANQTGTSSCSPVGELVTDLGCREWTAGAFCQECNVSDGSRYFSFTTSSCMVCTGSMASPLIYGSGLLLLLVGLVFLYHKVKPLERFQRLQMLHIRFTTMADHISLRANMKQCVGFYQVTTNIQDVYSIEMPADTQNFLDAIKGIVSFDVTKTFGLPLECARLSGYYRKLTFMMLWPIVVVVGLIAGHVSKQWYVLLRLYSRALKGLPDEDLDVRKVLIDELKRELKKGIKRSVLAALPAVSIITFLAFPSVSSIAFRAWACVEFDMVTKYDADNTPLPRAPPDVESFMRDDLRIQCGSPEHDDAASLVHI